MTNQLKTCIERDGQRYLDEPVYAKPKKRSGIELGVQAAFDPDALMHQPRPIVVSHERVLLRWMKPDGKGGLTPR